MKICWDTIEDLELTAKGHLRIKGRSTRYFIEKDNCLTCGEPFLAHDVYGIHDTHKYCSRRCKLLDSHPMSGRKGSKCATWRGGEEAPLYDTFASRLIYAEEVRRSLHDPKLLEVKCTYCGKWYVSKKSLVYRRIASLKGHRSGEARFYCSQGCKRACPIYRRVWYTKGYAPATPREVQPELRQIVLERDDWTCQFEDCGLTTKESELHCHHIIPVAVDSIISADIDNCITLCKEHHKLVHSKKGCTYNELKECL